MQLFVFFVISACMVGNVVQGEMALPSVDVDKQHSSAFLMMYKFMDDIFAIKNQMHELQKSVDDREDEIENQISGLKNTVDDRQEGLENQIIDLQEEISELKYLIGQLERQINEMGQNKGLPSYVPGPMVDIAKNYKMVTQSSTWPTPPHPAIQAIDGNSNKYSHTRIERNPWWSMEFCNDVIIAKVRLWNRVDCCDEQMANFVVTVGNETCGRVDGAIGVGHSVDVKCPTPLIGKVLRIQRTDDYLLSISELQVFSSVNTC